MIFNVPQFIEIQDKIAFQLTAKQLGIFGLGGVALFFIWKIDQDFFYIWFFLVLAICSAFAFITPYGMTLFTFFTRGIWHAVKPKVLVWEKKGKVIASGKRQKTLLETKKEQAEKINRSMKEEKLKKLDELAKKLDKYGGL